MVNNVTILTVLESAKPLSVKSEIICKQALTSAKSAVSVHRHYKAHRAINSGHQLGHNCFKAAPSLRLEEVFSAQCLETISTTSGSSQVPFWDW